MTNLVIKFLTVQNNSAESFARWMSGRRKELGITLDILEEKTGIKKQHLSVLERAAPHSLTGKAVIPKRPTVQKIAKGLQSPVDEALAAAGYMAQTQSGNSYEILDGIKLTFDEKKIPKKEQQKILDLVRVLAAGVKATETENEV